MPRDRAIIFADLIGKLDVIRVACDKSGRSASYTLATLIARYGATKSCSRGRMRGRDGRDSEGLSKPTWKPGSLRAGLGVAAQGREVAIAGSRSLGD
jgi:hypothetical protein